MMIVVRVGNDEATLFSAFRRVIAARRWASERSAEDHLSLVEIFDVSDVEDVMGAIHAVRSGSGVLIGSAGPERIPAWIAERHIAEQSLAQHAFA